MWRSSRQTVSSLSTAEAELGAAALAWQIVEGIRALLEEWGIELEPIKLLLDNDAALAIAEQGSNWRTRYFGVRACRIREELLKGRLLLGHEPTKTMVADALTKLATTDVLENIRKAMRGEYPPPCWVPCVAEGAAGSHTPGASGKPKAV